MPLTSTTITRSTAGPRLNALAVEGIIAFVGTSASGDVDTPVVLRTKDAPLETFGEGMMPEAAAIDIDYAKQIAIGVRATTATPGSYGTIDESGITGTAEAAVHSATVPTLDAEAYIEVVDGGTLGTAGITYVTSRDNGRKLGPRTALGTALSITVAGLDAQIDLDVPEDELVDLVVDIRAQVIAHFAMGAGTHNAADATSGAGIGGVPATRADAITRINQIRAALLLHADDSPTVHNSDDTTSFASLPAVATTGPAAVTLANAIVDAYAVHAANATVHDAADVTNVITETDALQGTLIAGDIIRVTTTAPKWDVTSLASALASLPGFQSESFGAVCVLGAITSDAEFDALRTGLADLRNAYKPVHIIAHVRLPNSGETEAQYRTALDTLQADWEDNRITVVAGNGRYVPGDISAEGHEYTRSPVAPIAARWARTDPAVSIAYVKEQLPEKSGPAQIGGPIAGFAIYDSADQPIGHDEYSNPGLDDLRYTVMRSHPLRGGDAYVNIPRTMAASGDRLYHASAARIVNMVERVIYFETSDLLQLDAIVDPDTYFLAPASRNQINGIVRGAIRRALGRRLSNIDNDEIFVLADNDNLNPDPPAVPEVNASCVLKTPQWIVKFNITLSVNP